MERNLKIGSIEHKGIRYHKFLERITDLNLELKIGLISKSKFSDDNIEKKYQEFRSIQNKQLKILSDFVLISGYFASLLYIIFAFYHFEFLIICLICKFISLTFIILSYFTNNQKIVLLCEHISIISIVISLVLKCLIVNLTYNTPENDNEAELIRIIIYYFVSVNLFIFFKFHDNIMIYLSYFLINIILIVISEMYSNKQNFYYLEAFTSFMFSSMFFGFRKVYDYLSRIIFSDKYKLERLYNYTFNYISSLNCFQINFQDENILYYDDKCESLLKIVFENMKDKLANFNVNDENYKITNDKSLYQSNDLSKTLELEKLLLTSNHNFSSINNKINDQTEMQNNLPIENKYNIYLFYLNLLIKKLILSKEGESESLSSIANCNKNINNNTDTALVFNNINSEIFGKDDDEQEKYLRNILIKIINNERKSDIKNIENRNNFFINIGIYTLKNPDVPKFFEIYFRKIYSDNNSFYYDLLLYDVTELVLSKKLIVHQNVVKQNILAKIAHEFKTPINSIIGLINNLKDSLFSNTCKKINQKSLNNYDCSFVKETEKKNNKLLDIIQNLSKYVIFLVSDIIQYSKMRDLSQININYQRLDLRESANFCFEILKCLLKCNKAKYENVVPELAFDDSIDKIVLFSDEIRIKQILLNLISNSVKFTKHGKIKLKFVHDKNLNEIKIIISDTGIGIKDEDKHKLFNDFVMLQNGQDQNKLGSGLGLSICKSLAMNLKINFNFNSVYGEGTKFIIHIPVEMDEINKKKMSNRIISKNINKNMSHNNVILYNKKSYKETFFYEADRHNLRSSKTKTEGNEEKIQKNVNKIYRNCVNNETSRSYDIKKNHVTVEFFYKINIINYSK